MGEPTPVGGGEEHTPSTDTEEVQQEAEVVEERATPKTPVIYEVVRRHGETEMARPAVSLWWSGVAAGLSISFSLFAEAILVMHLPAEASWSPLVSSFGYSLGFMMVILARQQLFTENTVTAVLPFMAKPTLAQGGRLIRMWLVVFAANMAGALLAALFCAYTPAIAPDVFQAMLEVSHHVLAGTWWTRLFGGISAGFLIATMVWVAPSTGPAQFLVIILLTWLIAVGGFSHIVVGSIEAFLLLLTGDLGLLEMISQFTIPVLIGNVLGGTALFAVLSHAQVMQEI